MQNPSTFSSATVSNANQKNGQQNVYTFTVTSVATVKPGEFYRLIIPSNMAFSSSLTCGGFSPLATSLTCSIQGNTQLLITIARADSSSTEFPKNTQLSFTVTNIRNPPALQTSSSLTVIQLQDSSGTKYAISSQSSSLTVTNTSQADLTSVSVSTTTPLISTKAGYTFTFSSPVPFVPQGTILTLTLPSTVQFDGTLSCTGTGGVASGLTCTRQGQTQAIQITGGWPSSSSNSNLAFSISDGLKNAQQSGQTSSFALNIKDSNSNAIANINSSIFLTFTCDSNCLTCQNDPTRCLTCDTSTSLKYFHNNKCFSECPDGFYQRDDSTPVCAPCHADCLTCSTSQTTCSSCKPAPAILIFLHQQTCVQTCPDKTFASTNQCLDCVSPCNTCSGSSTTCTSCDSSSTFRFLNSNTCLESCPDGKVQVGSQCQECTSPCATCSGVPSQCETCITGYLLYANTCVQSCPSGFTQDSNGIQCILIIEEKDQVLYFPILALFIFLLFLVMIIKCACRDIMFIKSFLMVQATVQVGSWFFMLYFLIRDSHWISSALVGGAIVGHILCNLLVICMHKILVKKDKMFNKYRQRYKKTYRCTYAYSVLISHKFYRHIQSFFVRKKSLKVVLDKPKRIINSMTMITFLSIFITSLPIIGACILNLFFNTVFLQLFYTDIEVLTITATMIAFEVADASIENKKIQKKQRVRFDENDKLIDPYKNDKSQNSISAISYEDQKINNQFLSLMMERIMKKNGNDYFVSEMADQEEVLNKGYHSQDEGQWRRRADKFKNDKDKCGSFPVTPRTKERTEKNFLMMQMLEEGDIGNLGDMQSVFLKTGAKWGPKRVPPSRGLQDFAITQAQGDMMFQPQRNLRPDSTLFRARQQELQKREAQVDLKNKRGEEILQAIRKQKEELEKLKNSHILRSGRNSPVGPLIIPAPFPKQGQGSIQDQQRSIAKGRRSSMDKTSTLFLRKSNMSDTMSGYNGSQLGSARGIESPVHSDRTISEKNITGGMSGRNSRVELIPEGPAFIGVVPVSESRQHTKTNFSNIQRDDDGEQQKQPKNLKQQASMKSLKNMKSKDKSLRSNKYSTDNLNNTSPIGSHKILPSIRSNKRLSPVQSPRQNQKISLKAKSIIDSSGANVNNNGSMDPSVAADSSTALVKQIAQSSARQGIQSEQQGNNYLPPVPLQTSVDEEEKKIASTKQNRIPQRDQDQQLKNGYDTVDQNIISEVQLQKANGQNAMIDNHHQSSLDNQQNNTSTEFPGVLAFPRGAGQGASKSPRNISNKKSSIKSSQKNKTNNTSTLNKQKSKKQLNASQSSSVIGQKSIKEKKNKKKKGVQRSSPRHLFQPDAMTVPVIENQKSDIQKLKNEIDDGYEGQISKDKLPSIYEQKVLPNVQSSKKGAKIKNKPPNLSKSYISDGPQGQGSEQPSLEKPINEIEKDESAQVHQGASKPGKHQVKDFVRQPTAGIQQGPKNISLKTINKPKMPQNNYDSSEMIFEQPDEYEDQKAINDQIPNHDQDENIEDDEGRLSLNPSKNIKTSPPKQDSFSIDIYDDQNKDTVNQNQIASKNGPIPRSQNQDFLPNVIPSLQPPTHQINNDPRQKKDAKSSSQNKSNIKNIHEERYDNLLPGDILDLEFQGQKASPSHDKFQNPNYEYGKTVDNPLASPSINKKNEQLPTADNFSPNISPYKLDRDPSPSHNDQGNQIKSKIIEHSERSASSFVNPEIEITPAAYVNDNKWRHSRIKNGPSRSQQIPQKRIGGNQFGIQPMHDINNYHSPPSQMANQGGMTPLLYPKAGFNNNIPFSARPQFGASSVSPVFITAGALSLEDTQNFNGFNRKQREKDVAGVVGGFGPIEPLKDSVSPMMPQMPFLTNVDGRNSTQNGRFQNEFYPKSNITNDQSFQQMYSNDPLSARNNAIPLNTGLPLQSSNGFSPHYNFGFQQGIPQNVYPTGNKMQQTQHRGQAPKTGKDFHNNNQNDMLRRAYKNPTQFQKLVLQGHKPNPILHPAVDIGYNFEEEKYEIQRSDRKKQKKKSKANLREQSEKAISIAPAGGMRNILNERLKGLENAYLPKPMGVKKKSKANLKSIETPRLALNKNQLGPHISPPHGQPPMSRMSPIPPNHNNYAFSPRK